jgi:hypothetical protein
MRARITAVAVLSCIALAGCCAIDIAPAAALVDAVKEEHMAYVLSDDQLDEEQRTRRMRTWFAFEAWISAVRGDER